MASAVTSMGSADVTQDLVEVQAGFRCFAAGPGADPDPITMPSGYFRAEAPSHTKGGIVDLIVSPEYLHADDRVILIDDFLATGLTIDALASLVAECGATLCGIGCIIEKSFEQGRARLAHLNVPIVTLAIVTSMEGDEIVVVNPDEV